MDLLTKGQKLTLYFQKDSNMVEITCDIESVRDDRIELNLPQYFMRYVDYLQVGKKLTAKAFSKFGTIDFNTIIITSPLEDSFMIELDYNSIKLTPGKDMPVIEAIEIMEVYKQEEVERLKTFEIATDYVKFYSDEKFEIEEEFDGAVILPKDYGIIKFRAVVTEIDPIYENEHTALFITMREDAKQNLLYYMYTYSTSLD